MSTAHDHASRLAELLRHEHSAMADFIAALAAFDAERHWEALGHKSLFWFLHRKLGLSKSAAYYRKTAAELVRDYPEVLDALRDGRLCVSSVAEVAKVVTRENVSEVLPRFFTLSKREAKEVTAELLPAATPPLREVVTVVQAPAPALALSLPAANSIPPSRGEEGAGARDARVGLAEASRRQGSRPLRPCRDSSGHLGAGPGQVSMAGGRRRHLRLHLPGRARPHRALREGWAHHPS